MLSTSFFTLLSTSAMMSANLTRRPVELTVSSSDWSLARYSEVITGSAAMWKSSGMSRLDTGMSALASTCRSSAMRPRSKRTVTSPRLQVNLRSLPIIGNVPSPVFGTPSSMARTRPAEVMVVCMTTRDGVGSAMASPGAPAGRAG